MRSSFVDHLKQAVLTSYPQKSIANHATRIRISHLVHGNGFGMGGSRVFPLKKRAHAPPTGLRTMRHYTCCREENGNGRRTPSDPRILGASHRRNDGGRTSCVSGRSLLLCHKQGKSTRKEEHGGRAQAVFGFLPCLGTASGPLAPELRPAPGVSARSGVECTTSCKPLGSPRRSKIHLLKKRNFALR